jgi:hypothetical protein
VVRTAATHPNLFRRPKQFRYQALYFHDIHCLILL